MMFLMVKGDPFDGWKELHYLQYGAAALVLAILLLKSPVDYHSRADAQDHANESADGTPASLQEPRGQMVVEGASNFLR